MSNSKSAFEKWHIKSFGCPPDVTTPTGQRYFYDIKAREIAWNDSKRYWLKWALRQKYKDGKGQTYGCMDNVVLDTKKIKAEIKKASKK